MKPLEKLVELYCVKAYCGYAGRIILHFDKNLELSKTDEQEVDWVFETISSAWRLSKNENLLTGSYEDYEHNDNEFRNLVGKKLLSIEHLNSTDVNLKFENNFQLAIFNHGITHPTLEIFSQKNYSEKTHLILQYTGEWKESEPNEGFTDKEEVAYQHSEKCYSRWKDIVPPESVDNHCRDCAYFLSNSGRFYFWDFGLCSNKKSVFDGKVVGAKSTCEYYNYELEK
jgi:hypothetical protein